MTRRRSRHTPNNMPYRLLNITSALALVGLPIFLVIGRVRGWF